MLRSRRFSLLPGLSCRLFVLVLVFMALSLLSPAPASAQTIHCWDSGAYPYGTTAQILSKPITDGHGGMYFNSISVSPANPSPGTACTITVDFYHDNDGLPYYCIDYGDGTEEGGAGAYFSDPGPGVVTHTYAQAGVYTFTVTMTDLVFTNTATFSIKVGSPATPTPPRPRRPCDCDSPRDSPAGEDPVNLATGTEEYRHEPDLTVYNPAGPSVAFRRSYYSDRALRGEYSPGLSPGWIEDYDETLSGTSGSWGALTLTYPNGAQDTLTPVLSGGSPTGAFTPEAGAEVIASGVPGSTTGIWTSVTVTDKSQTQYVFTPVAGVYAITTITDRMGHSITLNWDSGRKLQSIGNGGTTLLSCSYDSSGDLSGISDCYSRSVYYVFGATGDQSFGTGVDYSLTGTYLREVSQVIATGTSGPAWRWLYNYVGYGTVPLLSVVVDPSTATSGKSVSSIAYDGQARVSSFTDGNRNSHTYSYGTGGTYVQVLDGGGNLVNAWTQKFDSNLRDSGLTDAASHSTSIVYGDTSNPDQPTLVTDRNGKSWSYGYDSYGNLLTALSPRGVVTTNTYDMSHFALGRLTQVQEGISGGASKSPTTIAYYEPSGLVQTITSPLPGTVGSTSTVQTGYTYDSLGNPLTVTVPGNNAVTTKTFTFNYTTDGAYSQSAAIGQPLTVTDNLGNVVSHARYDSRGNCTSLTDALGNETDFTYNLADQAATKTYPATGQNGSGHSTETMTYLYTGGPLTQTTAYDESGAQVSRISYGIGQVGELLSVTGGTAPVYNTYDGLYRLSAVTDGNSHTTRYYYNAVGFLDSVTYPGYSGPTPAFNGVGWTNVTGADSVRYSSYDNDGNPLTRIDGRGVTTTYTYDDPENLLTNVHYTLPASPPATLASLADTSYTYDGYGRRATMSDATGTFAYSYDDYDALTGTQTSYAALSTAADPNLTLSFNYWPDGSRKSLAYGYYTLASPGTAAGAFTYNYDGDGRWTGLQDPNSQTAAWAYLNNGWLSSQTLKTGSTTIAATTYGHNARGFLTDLQNRDGSGSLLSEFGGSGTSAMTYDGLGNRLTMPVNIPASSLYSGSTTYTYDTITGIGTRSQLTQEATTRNGGVTNTFAYDGGSYTALTGVGNMTTVRSVARPGVFSADNQYSGDTYDGEGNPIAYVGNTMVFDPENHLVSFTKSGATHSYTYDGDDHCISTFTTGDSAPAYYVYDGENPLLKLNADGSASIFSDFGANGVFARNAHFYTWDPQGSAVQRITSAGVIEYTRSVDAFGTVTKTDSVSDSYSGFGGQWGYAIEGPFYRLGYRFYDPTTGRFLTRDPIGYAGGINLYGYVGNDPINENDPLGMDVGPKGPGSLASSGYTELPDSAVQNEAPFVREPRARTKTLRRAWEKYYNKSWPKDPDTGRNQDACHKKPLADGGSNDPENIEPKTHEEHVELHKQNGDYSRWGKRAQLSAGETTTEGAEAGATEAGGLESGAGAVEGAGALEAGEGGITLLDLLEAAGALLL